jgi:hypothetical protein
VRVFILHSIFFISCSFALHGGVASNPFLRPAVAPPPKPAVPPPPPKPQVNPSLAKEVQFRGYFLFKGVPHFCVFNTKSNHGEWIRLNEKTFEEFEAHSFDLEAESLTLHFNGQEIILSLIESTTGGSKSANPASVPSQSTNNYSTTSKPSSSTPKVMPPRPTVRPKLPDWLANRTVNRAPPSASYSPSSKSTFSPYAVLPPRGQSIGIGTSSEPVTANVTQGQIMANQITQPKSGVRSNSTSSNTLLTGTEANDQFVDSSSPSISESNSEIISTNNDLENLPPPPPPPNILPPGPPPNILPSRDD